MIVNVRPAWVYEILSQKINQTKTVSECRDPRLAKMLRVSDIEGSALNKTYYSSTVPSKGWETLWKQGRRRLQLRTAIH